MICELCGVLKSGYIHADECPYVDLRNTVEAALDKFGAAILNAERQE